MSTRFTGCFMPTACNGAARDFNAKIPELMVERNETCAPGYGGRLCHACVTNWGRESFDGCKQCPPKVGNMVLTVVGVLTVVIVLIGFIIFSITSSADEGSTSSMMFKTLAAYGQVVGIASLFPYKWPQEILELFKFMDTITSVSDRILNTDCALEARRGQGLPLLYEKAILYMMSPAIFMCCAFCVLICAHILINAPTVWGESLRRRLLKPESEWTREDTKRCFIVSCIVVMVIMHPTLVRQSMFLLMCVEVEGSYYLRKDVQLQCDTAAHNSMVAFVAAPGILLYVFLWPYSVYVVLKNRKHKMHMSGLAGHDTRAAYGFLYRGFAAKRYYWEIVIMIRKTAMVMVATFGLRATVQTQGMLALLVMAVAMTAHLKLQPYDEPMLDRLEFFGLGAATVTLYFGMFFFTEDVVFAPWWGYAVTFIIIAVNAVFSLVFVVSLFVALRDEYNAVNRCTTAFSLRCVRCYERHCVRYFPCLKPSIRSVRSTRELIQRKADRHSGFGGFHFDPSSAKGDRKKRRKERNRRILNNQKAGSNKALQMMPVPKARELARRSIMLTESIRKSDYKTHRRNNKARFLSDAITKLQSNAIEDEEFSEAVLRTLRRRGTSDGDASATFLSGYHAAVTNPLQKMSAAKKLGRKWKDQRGNNSAAQSRNVEMVSLADEDNGGGGSGSDGGGGGEEKSRTPGSAPVFDHNHGGATVPASTQVDDMTTGPFYDEASGGWYEIDSVTGVSRWVTSKNPLYEQEQDGATMSAEENAINYAVNPLCS